jgi:hypothetical protein
MCGVVTLAAVTSFGASTDFPRKPARIIVGIPAGSQPDTIARLPGSRLAETWAEPVVIHNVTGVAGSIAADRVAKAAPDGYTLGLLASNAAWASAGAFVSYAPDLLDVCRKAMDYSDRILRGSASAGNLPVQQPTKFSFIINQATAHSVGVTVPQSVLLRADQIIE